MAKIASTLKGLHGINSLENTGQRSIPPTPKSAFLDLFILQNNKERLTQERNILKMRRKQIDKRLSYINKGMVKMLKLALKSDAARDGGVEGGKKFKKSLVLQY